MPISEETYERVALEDPDGFWELDCGRLRRKPGMTTEHSYALQELARLLWAALDPQAYVVSVNTSRLRILNGRYYIPDLCVIPRETQRRKLRDMPRRLEVYEEAMPLVVEVWSPSTGDYDVEEKLREYQRRGDLEIWRVHPYERTLTAWRRQPDSRYQEALIRGGSVEPVALPGVRIDLDALFPA